MTSNFSLRSILEKESILNGTNYVEWYRKLKIILRAERKLYVLEDKEPDVPFVDASEEDVAAYEK